MMHLPAAMFVLVPPEHHVVEGDAEVGVGRQDLGHLDLDLYVLVVGAPLALQEHHLHTDRHPYLPSHLAINKIAVSLKGFHERCFRQLYENEQF